MLNFEDSKTVHGDLNKSGYSAFEYFNGFIICESGDYKIALTSKAQCVVIFGLNCLFLSAERDRIVYEQKNFTSHHKQDKFRNNRN